MLVPAKFRGTQSCRGVKGKTTPGPTVVTAVRRLCMLGGERRPGWSIVAELDVVDTYVHSTACTDRYCKVGRRVMDGGQGADSYSSH